jgi:hypothetical protein
MSTQTSDELTTANETKLQPQPDSSSPVFVVASSDLYVKVKSLTISCDLIVSAGKPD